MGRGKHDRYYQFTEEITYKTYATINEVRRITKLNYLHVIRLLKNGTLIGSKRYVYEMKGLHWCIDYASLDALQCIIKNSDEYDAKHNDPEMLCTVGAIARHLHVHHDRVRGLIDNGVITATTVTYVGPKSRRMDSIVVRKQDIQHLTKYTCTPGVDTVFCMKTNKEFYTTHKVTKVLGVSREYVRQLINSGKLKGGLVLSLSGSHMLGIDKDSLTSYIASKKHT